MRLARVVKAVNLKYAIGEILLIVIGIVIALQISEMHNARLERERELQLLAEIRTALRSDVAVLESDLQLWQVKAGQLRELIEVLDAHATYEPSMKRLFGAAYGQRPTNLNTAAYETLKSIGLQTIGNRHLRLGIARVFDHHYEKLGKLEGVEFRVIFDVLRPYYLQHFTNLEFLESATPIDYNGIVADTYYRNLVEYRLGVIVQNQLTIYAAAITDIRRALDLLDEELAGQD